MVSFQPIFASFLKSLPLGPIEHQTLTELVKDVLTKAKSKLSVENRKNQWEYLLKNEIFILAATEGKALEDENTTYYDELRDKLDLVLTFTEQDACEQTFPFIILQDLLETQTITSCSHIFSWIETRAARLTDGMVPQRGKALILLRTLNDLLRRLSKMGTTTIFCGRILTFLSGVFPLGERSGVNLRGEYGPTWEGVKDAEWSKSLEKSQEVKYEPGHESKGLKDVEDQDDKMQVDSRGVKRPTPTPKPPEKKEDFYGTFWSVQLPFSKPPLFAAANTFAEFKDAVNKIIPVIKEATAKERAMMGSRAGAGPASLKRKREPDTDETNNNEYFFAKFLTSPDLLDLEIADTHFRRQFLFQLLILLNHLLTFTKAAKATWSTPRNRSLQMDFTLETAEAQWVQETISKAMEELRQTTPNGRTFAETVCVVLEREKNWIKWKNELCAPFDKESWSAKLDGKKVGLLEATKTLRERMRDPPADWEWRLGTEPLTEIWDMGYRDLHDLQNPFQQGDVKDFVKKAKQEDARIELRKKNLARVAERLALKALIQASQTIATGPPSSEPNGPSFDSQETPAPPEAILPQTRSTTAPAAENPSNSPLHPSLPAKPGSSSPTKPPSKDAGRNSTPGPVPSTAPPAPPAQLPPTDEQISKYEENKQRWAWLALRTARDQYLQHFGKIGTGDIELLAQEIEKEKQEREKIQKGEDTALIVNTGAAEDQSGETLLNITAAAPLVGSEIIQSVEGSQKVYGEDVRMEDS